MDVHDLVIVRLYHGSLVVIRKTKLQQMSVYATKKMHAYLGPLCCVIKLYAFCFYCFF